MNTTAMNLLPMLPGVPSGLGMNSKPPGSAMGSVPEKKMGGTTCGSAPEAIDVSRQLVY